MNKFLKVAAMAAVASVAIYGSANAGVTQLFQGGVGGSTPVIQNYNSGAVNDLYSNVLSVNSNLAILHPAAPNDGQGALNPFSLPASQYLAILGGGSMEITFIKALRDFSFDWGSRDTYNTLKIYTTLGGAVPIIVIPAPGDGNQGAAATNGRFTATADPTDSITRIVFESSQNSFEIDNISGSAVPEPATWAMMIAGFGLAGTAIRRRRNILAVA